MIIETRGALPWLVTVFFGLCLVVGLVNVAIPPALLLDASGMTSRHLWRTNRYEWTKCTEFRPWRVPTARSVIQVVFDYETGSVRLKKLNRQISGASHSLPDTFGMDAAGLAELLNEYRVSSAQVHP